MIDPDVQNLLDTVFATDAPAVADPDVGVLRALALQVTMELGGVTEPVESLKDASVFGPGGLVRIRVYRGASDAPRPLYVYAHGGGWVTGSIATHDKLCRALANRLRAVLIAVDYRLAPEHEYPCALDDFDAIWRWSRTHAEELGADGHTFAVAGDSSGANLAAALTLRLRARGDPQPALQLLIYPALDARCGSASYREFARGYVLTGDAMRWYWQRYAGGREIDAPEFSPSLEQDLRGLAPAVVAVAENDVLRDDGLDYARALDAANVPVEVVRCEGMLHGFLRWRGAVRAVAHWLDVIAASAGRVLATQSREGAEARSA